MICFFSSFLLASCLAPLPCQDGGGERVSLMQQAELLADSSAGESGAGEADGWMHLSFTPVALRAKEQIVGYLYLPEAREDSQAFVAIPMGIHLPSLLRQAFTAKAAPVQETQQATQEGTPGAPRLRSSLGELPRLLHLPVPLAPRIIPEASFAQDQDEDLEDLLDLAELSLEDLMQIEVISVTRRPQTVTNSPAAIYVITQEDIRRSGHSSIPELLRLVPGLHAARVNSSSWAISARGFNGRFNNKMLVMIDGRTVFNSLFSGVFWDVQDLHLSDIERIEVVRGPGGSIWGANAVNGVINIITKKAADTQAGEISLRAGAEERILSTRVGGTLGAAGHWRMYAKGLDRGATLNADGSDHPDEWALQRAGGRLDWASGENDSFTLQGDLYNGRVGESSTVTERVPTPDRIFRGNFDVEGGNLLGRWTRQHSEASESELQVYLDLTMRRSALYQDQRNTLDVDFQHRRTLSPAHELLWGLAYRFSDSEFHGSAGFDLDQSKRSDQLFSAFVQDQVSLVPQELTLIMGAKFEHNDYTGFELQPSLRMLWVPSQDHVLWGAVSRAVRTPSVVQSDLIQDVAETTGPTSVVRTTLFGNDDLGADDLLAYELGWRYRLRDELYFDLTAFYNVFSAADNFSVGSTIDEGGGSFIVPVFFDNSRKATVLGAEMAIDLELSKDWKIRSGLTLLDLEFKGDVLGTPIQPLSDAEEPNYVGNLRSYWSIDEKLSLDLGFYAVDDLDDLGVGSYLRSDARLSYRPSAACELVLGVQNIGQGKHDEFGTVPLSSATYIQRALYFELTWRP